MAEVDQILDHHRRFMRTVATHAEPRFDLEGHSEPRQFIGLGAVGGGAVGSLIGVSVLRETPPEQREPQAPTQNPQPQQPETEVLRIRPRSVTPSAERAEQIPSTPQGTSTQQEEQVYEPVKGYRTDNPRPIRFD